MKKDKEYIKDGRYNVAYFDANYTPEHLKYHEINLGEMNLISNFTGNKHHLISDGSGEPQVSELHDESQSFLEYNKKSIPTETIIKKFGLNLSLDDFLAHINEYFNKFLNSGYLVLASRSFDIYTDVVVDSSYHRYDYFFAVKLDMISQNPFRIKEFLTYHSKRYKPGFVEMSYRDFLHHLLIKYKKKFEWDEDFIQIISDFIKNEPAGMDLDQPETKYPIRRVRGDNLTALNRNETVAFFNLFSDKDINVFLPFPNELTQTTITQFMEAVQILTGYEKSNLRGLVNNNITQTLNELTKKKLNKILSKAIQKLI